MSQSEKIQQELAAVKGNSELLNPAAVVDWAHEHQDSALYKCFEWNDGTAGRQYRIWQARSLIALHVVNVKGERKSVSLSIDRKAGGGYRDLDEVMRDPGLRDVMLQDALLELRRVRHKYQAVKELAAVFVEIEKADKQALEAAA